MTERLLRVVLVPLWLTSTLCWAGWVATHEILAAVRGE